MPDIATPPPAAPAADAPQSFADRIATRFAAATPAAPAPVVTPSIIPPAETPAAVVPPVETPATVVPPVETPVVTAADIPEEESLTESLGLPIDEAPEDAAPAADDGTPAGKAFARLKGENKTLLTELQSLRTKVTTYETQEAERRAAGDVDYRAKYEEASRELGTVRLEASPQYQTQVAAPLQDIVKRAEAFAAEHDVDGNAILDALWIQDDKARNNKLVDLTTGVAPVSQLDLLDLGRQSKALHLKHAELHANQDKVLAEIESEKQKQADEAIAQRATERATAVDKIRDHVSKKLPSYADQIKEYSEGLRTEDFDSFDANRRAYNALMGQLGPKILTENNQLIKDLAAATAEIERLKGGSASIVPGESSTTPPANETFAERFARRTRNILPGG